MRFIAPILILVLLFPPRAFAEEPRPPTIMGIAKGEKAPFNGVLLNETAAAQMFVDRDFTLEECKLKIDFQLGKERAKYDLLLKSTQVSLESLQQKYDSVTALKDKEIERLSKIALEKKNDYSTLWATGGFVVGVGLTIGLFYVASEVSNR